MPSIRSHSPSHLSSPLNHSIRSVHSGISAGVSMNSLYEGPRTEVLASIYGDPDSVRACFEHQQEEMHAIRRKALEFGLAERMQLDQAEELKQEQKQAWLAKKEARSRQRAWAEGKKSHRLRQLLARRKNTEQKQAKQAAATARQNDARARARGAVAGPLPCGCACVGWSVSRHETRRHLP